MKTLLPITLPLLLGFVLQAFAAPAEDTTLRAQAAQSLRRAVEFFRQEIAVHGTYLWQYSEDLSKREGEVVLFHDDMLDHLTDGFYLPVRPGSRPPPAGQALSSRQL